MSLQLPTILSPPTPCTPVPYAHFSPQVRSRSYRSSLSGRFPFWASPSLSRLANASGRIEFIIFLIMDWSFASGCSPPRLSATQLPSATDSQCSVRWGLPPHCWCALSGARGDPRSGEATVYAGFDLEQTQRSATRLASQIPSLLTIKLSQESKNSLNYVHSKDIG